MGLRSKVIGEERKGMKIFKKMVVVTLCMSMLGAVGCGTKEKTAELNEATIEVDADTPSWKVDTSSADLDWYINFDWFAQTWGSDLSSQFITEDTNVNVTYQGGSDDKLNTMLASGDLPDLITIDGTSPIVKDAAKFAMPLDVLAEKYDPYFLKHAAKQETLDFFTEEDSHIYGYPNFSAVKEDYEGDGIYGNQGFLVREDIYEQLGRPDMSTPEGFLAALEAAQNLGVKDELGRDITPFGVVDFGTPAGSVFQRALADFVGVPIITEDGEFYDRYTDEDFVLWMKTIATARREGYTEKDMITMTQADKDARVTNGSYFAYFTSDLIAETDCTSIWESDHPDKSYIAIDGPHSTKGRDKVLPAPGIEGWTLTFISKDCENPQKAMELLTYLVSEEGDMVMNYGREGETYTMVDGKPVLNADLLEFKQTDPAGFEKEIGLTTHLWLQDSVRLSGYMGLDQFPKSLQQAKAWTQDHVYPQFEVAQLDNELSKESARNVEKIQQRWNQTVATILESQSDAEVDQAIADFVQYRNENGYDKIVEERNAKIKSNIEKLN